MEEEEGVRMVPVEDHLKEWGEASMMVLKLLLGAVERVAPVENSVPTEVNKLNCYYLSNINLLFQSPLDNSFGSFVTCKNYIHYLFMYSSFSFSPLETLGPIF